MEIIKIISSSRGRMAICRKGPGAIAVSSFPVDCSDAEIAAAIPSESKAKKPSHGKEVDQKKRKG